MAALMAVFFLFNIRLGATSEWAVAAAIILGVTSHVTGFAVEFLQHPAEAFLLLLAFYFLFADSSAPAWRYRCTAGLLAGMMILVRASSVVLIPALTLYLLWHPFKRARTSTSPWLMITVKSCVPFLAPVFAAVLLTIAINHAKWGEFSFSGSYRAFNTFTNSWLVSLYGYLFSPGQSVFIFSPILLLAPVYFRPFVSKHPPEAWTILGLTVSYLLFYGRSLAWHGQWCFGPRYLMAMVPLLLLPLASWLGEAGRAARFAVLPFATAGVFIEILHVAVNVSYVYYREGYNRLIPSDAYIFVPQICQIVTHWRALLAFDDRVDMWLINVGRQLGTLRAIGILSVLVILWLISISRLYSCLRLAREAKETVRQPVCAASPAQFVIKLD